MIVLWGKEIKAMGSHYRTVQNDENKRFSQFLVEKAVVAIFASVEKILCRKNLLSKKFVGKYLSILASDTLFTLIVVHSICGFTLIVVQVK